MNPHAVLKKRQALDFFLTHLCRSEVKDAVAKVVLFGSLARGEARADSDIDLLVFATDRLDKVSEACAEASLCSGIEKQESVEPLIRDADTLFYTDSYFLTRALREGEEVYSMAEDELARKGAQNALRLAEEYIELARYDLEGEQLRGTVDAGYNAAELCVKGLLILHQQPLPRTHGGLVQKFGEMYVQTAKVERKLGRGLNQALQFRNNARYDAHAAVTTRQARQTITLAEELRAVLQALSAA